MKYLLTAALALLLVFAIIVDVFYTPVSGQLPVSFTVNGGTFNISSTAVTLQEQQHGLMNATVTNSTFMLFVFSNSSIYPFWMKNTYSPLDIIWINATNGTGSVVYVANAIPCVSYDKNQSSCMVYYPKADANYVIEARSGFMQRYNVGVGTPIRFNYNAT